MLEYFEETTDDKALSSGYDRIIRLNEIVALKQLMRLE